MTYQWMEPEDANVGRFVIALFANDNARHSFVMRAMPNGDGSWAFEDKDGFHLIDAKCIGWIEWPKQMKADIRNVEKLQEEV